MTLKMPASPPHWRALVEEAVRDDRFDAVYRAVPGPSVDGRYFHWDELRRREPPDGLSPEEWWLGLKLRRSGLLSEVPLVDEEGKPFAYLLTDPIPERLHEIDRGAGGFIEMPSQITNPETKDRYYVGSLIEEAITSSQLEGASTTRRVAREMIREGRPPRDKSERMILNNFTTMKHIGDVKRQKLTPDLVFEIHRLVTEGTLGDPSAAGRFRKPDEEIVVGDAYGEVFHTPPPADELDDRMETMCAFANGEIPDGFVHPALRSIILHFWLGYDHPFVDGNGRTARALFYWSMLHHGFCLFEFVSISRIILKGPKKYARAYLFTETDGNDLTYFILYHLEVIRRSVVELHEYIDRKTRELQDMEARLRGVSTLNYRQRALIGHALRHPAHSYTVASHQRSHGVVYETARTDLHDLCERGLLLRRKVGKRWRFQPASDLESRLARLD